MAVDDFGQYDDTRIRVLDEDELHKVLTAASCDVALWCRVTLESLLRISEVLHIRRKHIGATWVEVRRKGGSVQRVTITPALRAALLDRAHNSGYIFGVGSNGLPPARAAASLAVIREMRALALDGVSHPTMRHTGITLMLEAGISPRAIQKLAGWTESTGLRMLQRYGHARDAEMTRAVNVTAAAVARAQTRAQEGSELAAENLQVADFKGGVLNARQLEPDRRIAGLA